jgi:hypothetical protein
MTAILDVFRLYEEKDSLRGQILQLYFLAGRTSGEIAGIFAEEGLTVEKVEAHLKIGRVWLRQELRRCGISSPN